MLKTYELRLRPNTIQEDSLWKQLALTRELYNQGLEELIAHYKLRMKNLNRYVHDRQHSSKEHPDIPAVLVDTTIARLHQSFANFFRRCKYGGNKPKGFPRRPSGWYLQAVCETRRKLLPKTGKSIGLDFGLTHLVSDSDGNKVENPRHLKWSLRKLKMAQRRIARRKKGSNRRRKACRLAARIHEKISNQRRDYLHKTARNYVNRYDLIAVEDLEVSNMVQCRPLARAISDASWSMLRQLLTTKAEEAGRKVITVPPYWTTQKCSQCGDIVEKSLSVRTHCCPHCGYTDCRDTNAAKNILALALG